MNDFRLLIISNNCLSRHNSNGRTLLNLLHGFEKENLIQIYTSGEYPSEDLAAKFLRVSNKDIVCSYLKCRSILNVPPLHTKSASLPGGSGGRKTAATMLIRDMVWDCAWIQHRGILRWAKEQRPNAVLLQLSDSTLLMTLAMKVAQSLNLPLVTYNTEDYYFKNYDYMKRTHSMGLWYQIFHHRFQKKFRQLMNHVSRSVYNCRGLQELYQSQFDTMSHVIMPTSDFSANHKEKKSVKVTYAGNLGVGRHLSLIRVAESLRRIDQNVVIDVYGNANETIKKDLKDCPNICYHGFVSYEEVCDVMNSSTLLLHIESFDPYYRVDTRYAFSTKLVDCCLSEVPILLFAPCECEATSYFSKYDAAFVASEPDELDSVLSDALYDVDKRGQKVQNAIHLIQTNHNPKQNGKMMQKILKGNIE